jgi:hypothetical protein
VTPQSHLIYLKFHHPDSLPIDRED